MSITFKHRGDFSDTMKFLNRITKRDYRNVLAKYGAEGVAALESVTPRETGKTASSWTYEIVDGPKGITINWINTNVVDHVNIALILDTGHGTGLGTYVAGRHYIAPAIRPIMDRLADEAWKEVTGK